MINNRSNNSKVINYINKINKTINQAISQITDLPHTNSISHDFINQIISYQKFALQLVNSTLYHINNKYILTLAHSIYDTYPEIIEDMKKIKSISGNFKSCDGCINNYHKNFNLISQHIFSELKKVSRKQNINSYFLNLITIYYDGESKILQNLLRYQICPQLRLMAEYMLCLNNKKSNGIRALL